MSILREDMPALQVRMGGSWRYVFCRNSARRDPVTTHDRARALGAEALDYFRRHFADHEFRVEQGSRRRGA